VDIGIDAIPIIAPLEQMRSKEHVIIGLLDLIASSWLFIFPRVTPV